MGSVSSTYNQHYFWQQALFQTTCRFCHIQKIRPAVAGFNDSQQPRWLACFGNAKGTITLTKVFFPAHRSSD
jgi:hypothetical protein